MLVETVADALAGIGLRLCVADDTDQVWDPAVRELDIDQEDARDFLGRRLPPHLVARTWSHEPCWRFLRRENRANRRGLPAAPLIDRSPSYEMRRTSSRPAPNDQPGP